LKVWKYYLYYKIKQLMATNRKLKIENHYY
jgi:hypothetical protein